MVYLKISKRKGHRYAAIVKGVKENGKVKHIQIKHLGRYDKLIEKLASSIPVISLSDITIERALDFGDVIALAKIWDKLNLTQIINKFAVKEKGISCGDILEIWSINRALDPKSTNKIQTWYRKTILPYIKSIPPEKIYSELLCSSLDKFDNEVIFNIHKEINKILAREFNVDLQSVLYDITSTYFEGQKCIFAKFGYSRDKRKDKKQIIIGIVVSLDKGVPIYHFVDEGNVNDVTTKLNVDEKLKALGINNALMIHDRGMTSKENIRISDKLNYDYITALDSDTKQSNYWIERLRGDKTEYFVVDKHRKKCRQEDGSEKEIIYEVKIKEAITCEHKRIKKYVLLFDEALAKKKSETREKRLSDAKTQLEAIKDKVDRKTFRKKLTIINQIKKAISGCSKYFEIKTEEKEDNVESFTWNFKNEVQKKAEENDGYYVLICSDQTRSKLEIFSAFKYKCEIEAVIKELKQAINLHPIGHWKGIRPEGKVFICILAYLLRKVMKIILNENGIHDSVSSVLDVLSEVKEVEISAENGSVQKLTRLTTEKENLFKIFQIKSEI
ncbi:MAG: IS1634 family transposase [Nanoarchaeota archaeon]|nr:IS1634 family transposase [Nanoarchaeota archaeon]